MLWLLLLVAAPTSLDSHAGLCDVHRQPSVHARLISLEEHDRAEPEIAREMGFDYLRGDLLEKVGRQRAAAAAFVASLSTTPDLAPWARYRLARLEFGLAHPETAAGLVARVLSEDPPAALVTRAARLLRRAIDAGGDCRLLSDLTLARIPTTERRSLQVALATCWGSQGQTDRAEGLFWSVLAAEEGDDAGREAAERLDAGTPRGHPSIQIGRALHQHRQFDDALAHLEPLSVRLPPDIRRDRDYEIFYLVGRSRFWLEQFDEAAEAFGELARRTIDPRKQAKAGYQQARSLELAGHYRESLNAFIRVANIEPSSSWTAASLLAALRLQWTGGATDAAEATLELLSARRGWGSYFVRGALFMASSDLVNGRPDRAASWLRRAAQSRGAFTPELDYWMARHEELSGRAEAAVARYVKVIRQLPGHPLSESAARRLASAALTAAGRAMANDLAASSRREDQIAAWVLRRHDGPDRARLAKGVYQLLVKDSRLAPLLKLSAVDPSEWPLWDRPLDTPERRLIALGQFHDAGRLAVLRVFPTSDPALALTAVERLRWSGAVRDSLYVAEGLHKTVSRSIPPAFLPVPLRRSLYPFPYERLVLHATADEDGDPALLVAIMREESRFDSNALSAAAARGLTQFVYPTAERIAKRIGIEMTSANDLYRPEIAIALGATYLSDLHREFGGNTVAIAAAYNAGEAQARLWRSYCVGDEEAELYSKVGFRETRAYVARVATSRSNYLELYESLAAAAGRATSTVSTSGGSGRSTRSR